MHADRPRDWSKILVEMPKPAGLAFLFFATALIAGPSLGAQEAYEIGPGDVLRVLVLSQTEMSGEMVVDAEGMLAFPILGKMKASGLTPKELERKITTLLADGYLRRPEVSVTIQEYRSQRVYVTGEVQKPGAYALRADRTLLALLGEVGTLLPSAGHEVVVIRPPKGLPTPVPVEEPASQAPGAEGSEPEATPSAAPGAEILRVNLADLRAGKSEANIPLQLGDTIHFPKASQIYVSGRVARPGAYRYEAGTTVLQALAVAGGVTERGSAGRVKVIRLVNGKKQEFKPKLTDTLAPEDTLIVPESFF
jgi:polysaccharide export outer membrane protein